VHTSQKEGFGLIFLEALILNTPIVATESIGGMRDIMKGEILSQQIVPRDPELLAEKIVETIKAPYQSSDVFYREYEASTAFDKLLSRLESF
jgi:glycosyltransferase involved in cell wall biosynthesis